MPGAPCYATHRAVVRGWGGGNRSDGAEGRGDVWEEGMMQDTMRFTESHWVLGLLLLRRMGSVLVVLVSGTVLTWWIVEAALGPSLSDLTNAPNLVCLRFGTP